MLDAATVAFLEGGCALVVGTVGEAGEPFVSRGWGLTILGDDPPTARLLLAAGDTRTLAHVAEGGRIAVTGTDVPTLRSRQVKGHGIGVEPATDGDRARARRFLDEFTRDVHDTEGTPRRLLDRLAPPDYAACTIVIDEVYDQTPGPGAGAPVARP
jgi:hypothetical protein